MRFRIPAVLVCGLVVATLGSGVGLAAPAFATETLPCDTTATVQLSQLSQLGNPRCDYSEARIDIGDKRAMPVPKPGYSVQLSVATATGVDGLDDVLVARDASGSLGVMVGGQTYGDQTAISSIQPMGGQTTPPGPQLLANKCDNTTYSLLGFAWTGGYGWWYNSTSSGASGSLNAMQNAASTWVGFTSACGQTIANNATGSYNGSTSVTPQVNSDVTCGSYDAQSTIGWGAMSTANGTLAATCTWRVGSVPFDSDQRYNTSYPWSASSSCSGSVYDVQGVATHEFGHSYGLGHVAGSTGQVMKPTSDYCETGMRSLGLGDAYGVKAIYG